MKNTKSWVTQQVGKFSFNKNTMKNQQVSCKIIILAKGKLKLLFMESPYRSEEELLDAFLRHQPAAEKYIYAHGWLFTKKFVMQNSGDEEDAKDIMQDAMLIFYKKLAGGQYQKRAGVSCFTFLNEISKRLWWYQLQKTSRRKAMFSLPPDTENLPTDTPDDEGEQNKDALINLLYQALEQLGEPCHKIIKLGYFEKLSHKDIAIIFGYTEGYAKKKRHTCLQKLMSIYETLKPEENDQ